MKRDAFRMSCIFFVIVRVPKPSQKIDEEFSDIHKFRQFQFFFLVKIRAMRDIWPNESENNVGKGVYRGK